MEGFIIFRIDEVTYALPTSTVRQLEMVETITPVPTAPEYIDGVVSIRGEVVPVINMRKRFGLAEVPPGMETRLVVVQQDDRVVALLVDSAREFVTLAEDAFQPPPKELGVEWVEGIAQQEGRTVLLLDLKEVLDGKA